MLLNWVLEKTLESPLDWKEIKPVQPKRNQSWLFIGRTNAEVETPILWPPDALNWLIWKDPDAGKDWRQEENRTTVWDGWMASPTQWTWVWVKSRTWWWTGRPGMLRSLGSPRVRRDWATEHNCQRPGFISWLSNLFHWSMCLFLHQNHAVLINVVFTV